MDFSDCFNRMRFGQKKVTRPSYKDSYLRVKLSPENKRELVCGSSEETEHAWVPTNEDILAEDWELHFGNS